MLDIQKELKKIFQDSNMSAASFAERYGGWKGTKTAQSTYLYGLINHDIGKERIKATKGIIRKYYEENQKNKDIFEYAKEPIKPLPNILKTSEQLPSIDDREIIYLLKEILYTLRELRDATRTPSLKKGDIFETAIPKDQLQKFRIINRSH